jgi:hypothetical protein
MLPHNTDNLVQRRWIRTKKKLRRAHLPIRGLAQAKKLDNREGAELYDVV